MLRDEVRQAVADGKFHIYPVRTIDEGLQILTGVPAGELQEDGSYPEDSIHGLVAARLQEIAANLKETGKTAEEEAEEAEAGGSMHGEAAADQAGDADDAPDEGDAPSDTESKPVQRS
jgi:hypothetical protein